MVAMVHDGPFSVAAAVLTAKGVRFDLLFIGESYLTKNSKGGGSF